MAKVKLTPELSQEICKYIKQGLSNRTAADCAGITESTFYSYIRQGEADLEKQKTTIFSQFLQSLKKAESAHKLGRLAVIRRAADEGNWQAAAWELERRYRDDYGRNAVDARVELSGKDGGPVETKSTVQIYVPDNGRSVKH